MPRTAAAPASPPKDDNQRNLSVADLVEMAIASLKDLEAQAEVALAAKVPADIPSEDVAKDVITVSKQTNLIATDFATKVTDLVAPLVAGIEQIKEAAKMTTDRLGSKKSQANGALKKFMAANNIKSLRNDLGYLASRRAASLEVEYTDPTKVPLEYMAPDDKAIKKAVEDAGDRAVEALDLPPEKKRTDEDRAKVEAAIKKAREETVPGARVVLGEPTIVVS